jgi:glycosyltransferase involved in cell wall biosynthesis
VLASGKSVMPSTSILAMARRKTLIAGSRLRGLVRGRARRTVRALRRGDKRSVLFLRNSYYHFYYLAQALRRRGWDAVSVSFEDPNGPNANYYHGEDVNVFSSDPEKLHRNIEGVFAEAVERFDLLHFAEDGLLSFFPENWESETPADIIRWRARGRKIAYTISGCNSGVAQSSVARWSALGGSVVCDKCVWQLRPDICSDQKNLAWGRKVDTYCDATFTEGSPALDYQSTSKCVREPTTMCLDPSFWRPDLEVPNHLKIERKEQEFIVYHSFGNYESRSNGGRNIKGTGAVVAAIERLQSEGIPVRLVFVTRVRNTEARFLQVQADVIVDQLNYGRYGAGAREGMMLGRPTVCYINPNEIASNVALPWLREVPLVSATEGTIYGVLKDLLLNEERRRRIGQASREYALKWHGADACAERYEAIYDLIIRGELGGEGRHLVPNGGPGWSANPGVEEEGKS